MKFSKWIKLREMMGSVGSIVSSKDCNNPNFQVQGAYCKNRKKPLMMKFNDTKNKK